MTNSNSLRALSLDEKLLESCDGKYFSMDRASSNAPDVFISHVSSNNALPECFFSTNRTSKNAPDVFTSHVICNIAIPFRSNSTVDTNLPLSQSFPNSTPEHSSSSALKSAFLVSQTESST